ncbi:MAG: hypothetical protein Q7S22_06830 [Candidatus Micrarchaeota archaeon]|nr:hypothetical protein [Candidatus Micrarchaeota archaeon]
MADEGDRKMWAAIAWGLGLLGLILVLVTDKKTDKELKFYGVQGVLFGVTLGILWVGLGIVGAILGALPVVGFIGGILLFIVTVLLIPIYGLVWLYGLWKAYTLEHFKLPILGDLAEKFSASL